MSEHTRLPWEVDPDNPGVVREATLDGLQITGEIGPAYAAFIVRACNAHDDLLEACEADEAVRVARLAERNHKTEEVEKILTAWSERVHASGVPFSPNAPIERHDLARFATTIRQAAIAKATQESKGE